jgi:hypothetical protein
MMSSVMVVAMRPATCSVFTGVTPRERFSHVAPPSLVEMMAPQSPTAHAVRASIAFTLKRCFSIGSGVDCRFQVLPASSLWITSADLPTAQACCASPKSTLKSGSCVPLSTGCHVLPASVVCWRAPKFPTAHASLGPSARTP